MGFITTKEATVDSAAQKRLEVAIVALHELRQKRNELDKLVKEHDEVIKAVMSEGRLREGLTDLTADIGALHYTVPVRLQVRESISTEDARTILPADLYEAVVKRTEFSVVGQIKVKMQDKEAAPF